jgi:hypothetical protein
MQATPIDRTFGRRASPPGLVTGTVGRTAGSDAWASPRAKAIVVRSAKWKTGLFALAAALAAAQALLEIQLRLGGRFRLGMALEMAQPLFLLAAACAFAALVIRRPILTISADGLSLRHFRGGRWAWDEIERIEMRMSRRGFLQVVLRLDDSGGATRRRLPGMWTTPPHQLAAMLEAARHTASKGRREDVIRTVEAARAAHADGNLPAPIQRLARTMQRIWSPAR